MLDKIKQMMDLKRQADQIKRELDDIIAEVNEVRGIRVVITGSQHFKSVEIEEGLLRSENKTKLEGDLLRSLNAAVHKSHQMAAQKMKSVLPGLPGIV